MSKKKVNPVETVGKLAIDLQKKRDLKIDSIELQKEIHKGNFSKRSYEEEVWETIKRGCQDETIKGNFYIVVLFKKERLLQNVVRQYFFYRKSCPTPEFDQTVYRYQPKADSIEFLWTIPNNAACLTLPSRKNDLPIDQQWLISMIESFQDGDLDRYADRLNDEAFVPLK